MKMNLLSILQRNAMAVTLLLAINSLPGAEASAAGPRGANAKGSDPDVVGEEAAVLTQAPNVPPPIKRSHATKVVVKLEVKEVVRKMSDGVEYLFWTFG